MKVCPTKECGVPIRGGFLLCTHHWRLVPVAIRKEVMAAFKATGGGNLQTWQDIVEKVGTAESCRLMNMLRAAQKRAIDASFREKVNP
jgi:hypothetical protein